MIAYPESGLYNCDAILQAREAFKASKISVESLQKIEESYPCKLYTPNLFIAVGLGLVTILAFSFTAFLLGLLMMDDISSGLSALFTIMTAISYIFLEKMVKNKMYFNAGIDNALMILVLLFISGIFISVEDNAPWIWMNAVLMVVSLWLSVRFADAFMAMVSCAFFFVFCFLLFLKSGGTIIPWFAILMLMVIGAMYFLIKKIAKKISFVYEKCISALTIFLLVAFYAAGNYWVISVLQSLVSDQSFVLLYAWFFWILTFLLPVAYIVYGIVKKDLLHIRAGILLMMISILTYKYFFSFLPVEVEMLLLGIVLIAGCYFLIKWLQPGRHGYTSEMISSRPSWKNIEALVIAETMSGGEIPNEDNLMAGGSGGGAGASGDF